MSIFHRMGLAGVICLLSSCASVKLSVINETGGEIADVSVEMNDQHWRLERLSPGQAVEKDYKIAKKTAPRLSYLNHKGQRIYASANLEFKKGQRRKVALVLNARNLVEVREKAKQEKRKY